VTTPPARATLRAVAVVALAACTGANDERTSADASSASARDSITAGPTRATATPDTCAPDTAFRHDDPVALVEEWVRRDAEGPMERADVAEAWAAGALVCECAITCTPIATR
jgi:hypothetical protein